MLLTTTDGPIDFRYETAAPAAVGNRGSIAFRIDAGNVGLFQSTDGTATGWIQLLPAGGSVTFLSAATWTLPDNNATAWVIGTSGKASMVTFDTRNAIERVVVDAALLTTNGVASGTERAVGGRAFSTTADSAAIAGNGAAQAFNQSYALPASSLPAGGTVRVSGCVRRTGINGADTATVIVRFGGSAYVTSPAVAAAAGDRCFFTLLLTARAAPGAAVTVVGAGCAGWSTAAAIEKADGNSVALATNGALTVDVQITMPNNVANTAVLEQLVVDVV